MACTVDLGPWGGDEGDFWELHGDVWKIYVEHGDIVDSLTIGYIKGGIKKKTVTFGRTGKNKHEIIFEKDEHLVMIEGSVVTLESKEVVSSLTFITNRGSYGPFGKKSKTEFSPPVKAGKIAGLFGFAGKQLNAIGLSFVPKEACAVYVGPWGDHGGRFWEVHGDIRKITVQHGDVIDSLIINYKKGGIPKESVRFGGGAGGSKEEEISLDSDDYLVTIKGSVNTRRLVSSLTFITKKHPNGIKTVGEESGEEFYLPVKETKCEGLFGFVGLHGMHLNAIGLSLVPTNGGTVELGPWGGDGGRSWAYEGEIRSFQVETDGAVIFSITLNGTRFGGSGGTSSDLVKLESGEYLLSIGAAGEHVLQTISFVTNRNIYGPYGKKVEGYLPLDPPVKNGKIVSISGQEGNYIYAIAYKVAPLPE